MKKKSCSDWNNCLSIDIICWRTKRYISHWYVKYSILSSLRQKTILSIHWIGSPWPWGTLRTPWRLDHTEKDISARSWWLRSARPVFVQSSPLSDRNKFFHCKIGLFSLFPYSSFSRDTLDESLSRFQIRRNLIEPLDVVIEILESLRPKFWGKWKKNQSKWRSDETTLSKF